MKIKLMLAICVIAVLVGCAVYSRENKVFFPGPDGERLYHSEKVQYIGLAGFMDDAQSTKTLLVATHFEQPVTEETREMGISIGGVISTIIDLITGIFK